MDWDDIHLMLIGNLDATLRLRLLFSVHNCVQIPHNSTIRLEILAAVSVDSSVGAPTTYLKNSLRRPGTHLEEFRHQHLPYSVISRSMFAEINFARSVVSVIYCRSRSISRNQCRAINFSRSIFSRSILLHPK